jgi:hypothetical protein
MQKPDPQIGQILANEKEAHAKSPRGKGAKKEKEYSFALFSSFASLPLSAFA